MTRKPALGQRVVKPVRAVRNEAERLEAARQVIPAQAAVLQAYRQGALDAIEWVRDSRAKPPTHYLLVDRERIFTGRKG